MKALRLVSLFAKRRVRLFSTRPPIFTGPKAFEELRDQAEETKESAAKNLSLRLLQSETPEEVLRVFERDFLRPQKTSYPEELALVLYFVVKNLSAAGLSQAQGAKLVAADLRFQTLLNLVLARLPELQLDYVVSAVWSLGICVSAFGLEVAPESKLRLLATLNALLDKEEAFHQYPNLPSLAFSLTCFFAPEDMNALVTETVARVSRVYVEHMLERMDLLACSSLLMSWARARLRDEQLLAAVADEILAKHRQKLFYEEGALAEVTNVM